MLFFLLICNILFIPIISGLNTTAEGPSFNKSLLAKESPKVEQKLNLTASNITIITEGGPTVQSTPPITLPKENITNLLSLDKELGKDKSVPTSVSKVVPRKGVQYHVDNNTAIEIKNQEHHNISKTNDMKLSKAHTILDKGLPHGINVSQDDLKVNTTPPVSITSSSKNINNTVPSMVEIKVNKIIHKKPLVLSNEVLDKMDIQDKSVKIPKILSSSESIVSNQIPFLNEEESVKQTETKGTNEHPGMIMPVVITILVVPMFAVLGYMALRRGREAWKNRHYKRMDFLLDGMYNE